MKQNLKVMGRCSTDELPWKKQDFHEEIYLYLRAFFRGIDATCTEVLPCKLLASCRNFVEGVRKQVVLNIYYFHGGSFTRTLPWKSMQASGALMTFNIDFPWEACTVCQLPYAQAHRIQRNIGILETQQIRASDSEDYVVYGFQTPR